MTLTVISNGETRIIIEHKAKPRGFKNPCGFLALFFIFNL